jgi:hypothetical protein
MQRKCKSVSNQNKDYVKPNQVRFYQNSIKACSRYESKLYASNFTNQMLKLAPKLRNTVRNITDNIIQTELKFLAVITAIAIQSRNC